MKKIIPILLLSGFIPSTQAEFTVGNADETQFTTYPLNWENVNVNTATLNANNTQIDVTFDSGKSGFGNANFTIGRVFAHNETFNIPAGYRIRDIDWTFQGHTTSGSTQNWFPVLVQGGNFYREDITSGNPYNGAGLHNVSAPLNLASDWFLTSSSTVDPGPNSNPGGTGFHTYRFSSTLPEFEDNGSPINFGFIQWNASTGGSQNETFGTIVDDFNVQIRLQANAAPEPGTGVLTILGGAALATYLRRRNAGSYLRKA